MKSDRLGLFDLIGGVEAELDGVEDVQVDQGVRLVGVALGLLRLVLYGGGCFDRIPYTQSDDRFT